MSVRLYIWSIETKISARFIGGIINQGLVKIFWKFVQKSSHNLWVISPELLLNQFSIQLNRVVQKNEKQFQKIFQDANQSLR